MSEKLSETLAKAFMERMKYEDFFITEEIMTAWFKKCLDEYKNHCETKTTASPLIKSEEIKNGEQRLRHEKRR